MTQMARITNQTNQKKVQNHNENQNEKESKPTITKEVIQITPTNTTANPPTHTSTNDTGAEESIEYVLKQRKQQMEEKQKEPKKKQNLIYQRDLIMEKQFPRPQKKEKVR